RRPRRHPLPHVADRGGAPRDGDHAVGARRHRVHRAHRTGAAVEAALAHPPARAAPRADAERPRSRVHFSSRGAAVTEPLSASSSPRRSSVSVFFSFSFQINKSQSAWQPCPCMLKVRRLDLASPAERFERRLIVDAALEKRQVKRAYKLYAPAYDFIFDWIFNP